MIRVECFVDDKNIAKVLHVLNGLVLNLQVQPVVNAKKNGSKIVAETSGGTLLEFLEKHLNDTKTKEISPREIADVVESSGRSRKSYYYVTKQAIAAKLLKKKAGTTGKDSVYVVQLGN